MHMLAEKSWPGKLAVEYVELIDALTAGMKTSAGRGGSGGGGLDGVGDADNTGGVLGLGPVSVLMGGEGHDGGGGGGEGFAIGGNEGALNGSGEEESGGGRVGGSERAGPADPNAVTSATARKRSVPGSSRVTTEPLAGVEHVTVNGPALSAAAVSVLHSDMPAVLDG